MSALRRPMTPEGVVTNMRHLARLVAREEIEIEIKAVVARMEQLIDERVEARLRRWRPVPEWRPPVAEPCRFCGKVSL